MNQAYAIIMAGGKGERFWPMSTSKHPKQFLSLVGDTPLLDQAIERLDGLIPPERIFVITNHDLIEEGRKAASRLPAENVIGEPVGRDTAAAVALGTGLVQARDPDGVLAVLTADHIIGDLDIFRATMRDAFTLAVEEEVLITIGVNPREPSTAYGYIETGALHRETTDGTRFMQARRFVEKPDRETAIHYLKAGNYYWNSGMFVWSVRAIANAFARFRPPLAELIRQTADAAAAGSLDTAMADLYPALEKISIDYAVMEKADNIVTAKGIFAWDDVGSWPALADHFPSDPHDNTFVGKVESIDAADNMVVSRDRLTALIGVENLIVVQAEGATLVCRRDRAQDIKQLVHQLKATGRYDEVL